LWAKAFCFAKRVRNANKKAGETAGFFELIGSDRDQYFATTGAPKR